jgi:periplasmic protein TonB
MFEDSLVESTGRIRTYSKVYAVGSFAMQAALLAVLILIPYIYPDSLPKQALSTLWIPPLPPAAPAQIPHALATHSASPVQLAGLVAPAVIPHYVLDGDSASPAPPGTDTVLGKGGDVNGALSLLGSTPPAPDVVRPKPTGPIRISAGVAEGHILVPIQPVYPAIARTARIQGTVMIEAVITKQGLVDQARVVSGPALLAQAALAAVGRARYQPFKLNGNPVDVETTINIIFTLDN